MCQYFLRLNNIPLYMYILHFVNHLSVGGHWGSLHLLAFVNDTAVNIGVTHM